MFIRPCYRKKNGKRHAYWALVESYRTRHGPRQRVVAYLGQLDEKGRLGVKEVAQGRPAHRQKKLFEEVEPQWVEVDAANVPVEIPGRKGAIRGITARTVSRSALPWWCRSAECRSATTCSRAIVPT